MIAFGWCCPGAVQAFTDVATQLQTTLDKLAKSQTLTSTQKLQEVSSSCVMHASHELKLAHSRVSCHVAMSRLASIQLMLMLHVLVMAY